MTRATWNGLGVAGHVERDPGDRAGHHYTGGTPPSVSVDQVAIEYVVDEETYEAWITGDGQEDKPRWWLCLIDGERGEGDLDVLRRVFGAAGADALLRLRELARSAILRCYGSEIEDALVAAESKEEGP